jgi:hypothetical protein
MIIVLIGLLVAAVAAALWIWHRQTRCPRCHHRTASRMDSRPLAPLLYCTCCRLEWVPALTIQLRWPSRRSSEADSRP